ncbi:MAG TPA: hydrogenase maturation protease [Aromatoleum sp.]|uniref:hydrogenase maturation protease n=1 Tax=Aromatoleum sp. TaxID=2307007 RepID=UPI002B489C2B|nr:hydrogenase maturation protease [Aromatoleum sp.]HJV28257.1 hydrogenase maturation protease [Aromatoleum sp.]
MFAIGNESRGDDALGPMLASRIESFLPQETRLIVDFQLQVEHALELEGARLALFIDASCITESPFTFREESPSGSSPTFSHALEPDAVLAVSQRLAGRSPPAFVLGIRAQSFELGEGLSKQARSDIEEAVIFVCDLLCEPEVDRWRAIARGRTGQ